MSPLVCKSTCTYFKHTGYCYCPYTIKMPWFDAKAFCRHLKHSWGGESDLASVHDEKTMQFLVSLAMTKKHKDWKSYGHEAFWIGLCKTRGSWQWTDNTPFCYNNWGTGQPTNGKLAYDELFVEFYLVSLICHLTIVKSYIHQIRVSTTGGTLLQENGMTIGK